MENIVTSVGKTIFEQLFTSKSNPFFPFNLEVGFV